MDLQPLREAIAALPSLDFGEFTARPLLPLPQQPAARRVPCTLNLRSFRSQIDDRLLLVLAIAYLLGAIPFGYLLVKWKTGGDVRASGSGNIGATNVLRTTGRAAGVARCCWISPKDTWRSGSPDGLPGAIPSG